MTKQQRQAREGEWGVVREADWVGPIRSSMPGEALDSGCSAGPWRVASRKMLCFVLHFLSVPLGAGWSMVQGGKNGPGKTIRKLEGLSR